MFYNKMMPIVNIIVEENIIIHTIQNSSKYFQAKFSENMKNMLKTEVILCFSETAFI